MVSASRPATARGAASTAAPAAGAVGAERQKILETLTSPRFADCTPYTAWARLLDEDGTYLASVRTFYRVLAAEGLVQERRNQLVHPAHVKPELIATAPNQVWSWDITRLRSTMKWQFFYLYVLLDIFSRYVVGLARRRRRERRPCPRADRGDLRRSTASPATRSRCIRIAAARCAPRPPPSCSSIWAWRRASRARGSPTTTRSPRRSSRR